MSKDFFTTPLQERNAFAIRLYEEHYDALFSYAAGLCRRFRLNAMIAEDVVQEVFVKVLTDTEAVMEGYKIKGYYFLAAMTRHRMIDACRKEKSLQRIKDICGERIAHASADIFSLIPGLNIQELLRQVRGLLPELHYAATELYMMGYVLREIAEKMGISESKAFRIVNQAKKILLDHFSQRN